MARKRKRRIGHRRTYVDFYRPTVTGQNASGEDIVEMVHLLSAWVAIEALGGNELEQYRQLWAMARFRIEMNHPLDTTFQRADRIYWGSPARVLDILDVEDPDQRMRDLILVAKDYTE